MEIRPIFEAEDFGAALTPEMRESEARMRKELESRNRSKRRSSLMSHAWQFEVPTEHESRPLQFPGENAMRFMLIRKADEDTEAGAKPSPQVLADMGKYMDEMGKAGIVLAGEGLQPSSMGCRVKFTRGQPAITDGPFIETKELIAGFSIIRVNSRQEAIEWAKRWPASDAGGNVEIEIRQIIEPEDFGPEATAEVKKMRAHWDKRK